MKKKLFKFLIVLIMGIAILGGTQVFADDENGSGNGTTYYLYFSIEGRNYVQKLNLFLGEHENEKLFVNSSSGWDTPADSSNFSWSSSDPSIVTVDNDGNIKALKEGTATIRVSLLGGNEADATCDVTVLPKPIFTDFSNAKYETSLYDNTVTLKITEVTPKDVTGNFYYYVITPNNQKPEIVISSNGGIDKTNSKAELEYLVVNAKENYLYSYYMSKYEELNQDLYIWILQEQTLTSNYESYYDKNGNSVTKTTKFLVEGKKLERTQLPQLNVILQGFDIGQWSTNDNKSTWINFNFPTATENRKFTLKIGKVTDKNILSKIQKNDYAGITELLEYAKKDNAIYNKTLTTTEKGYYYNKTTSLLDGRKLLTSEAYYYVYAQFDDENGKYYPIEGITLAQAYISEVSDWWWLYGYTDSNFKWDGLTSTYTATTVASDSTTNTKAKTTTSNSSTTTKTKTTGSTPTKLPKTGTSITIIALIGMVFAIAGYTYYKNKKYRGI